MAGLRLRLPGCSAAAVRPRGNGGAQRLCRKIGSPSKYVTQTIPQSTEELEAAAEAEVMTEGNAVENAEVKIIKLTILRALSVTCSETARSSRCLELSGTEEKKMQKNERKRKKKKEQQIFSQNNKGGKKLPAKKIPHEKSSFLSLQNNTISQKKNKVAQRILSARLHKIKELKNEISDLQHKLEASNLENQVLKRLLYRHSKAIGGYESSESVLPDLLTRHYSEVSALRKHLRISQEEERRASRKLRKVEAELLKAKDDLQALYKLSEDKTLAERDELYHRLSVLTEKMEVNNKRIQEKDRQLYIKNIYTNRLLKIPKDKGDAVSHKKSLSINTSLQADKQHFRSLQLPQYQPQETEESLVLLHEEKKASEGKNQKAKASEAYTDAQCETEKQSSKKIPKPETFSRTHKEYLKENKPLTVHTCLEFISQEERKRDLLKQKPEKGEETLLNDSVKENNQEEDAVEEKEKKSEEQLSKSGKAGSDFLTPRNRTLSKLKKQYVFSETTENLHQGLPTSGAKSTKGNLCNQRHASQDQCKEAESKVKKLFGLYEPPLSKVTKTRQKDSSTEAEGCAHTIFSERKKSLMKELFGEGGVCKDNHSCSNRRGMERKL
ncbi:lebercilin-like protein isoform X3 [Gallus gallus]|uniref:lebercilin-like protein isoform X3 n=1 Tax=Gallus gallus TaxID=9031 RepID=UPI000240B2DE|nr:lebercilin-like protein isoform X3 [Gallus gallus]|eukprot:XP_015156750.1 lebercilin-like protein isoform X3 [Gallus gallus]